MCSQLQVFFHSQATACTPRTLLRVPISSGRTGQLHPTSLLPRCAQVVVATCNGAGEARLEGLLFRIVVLDEASQATEASRWGRDPTV